MNKIAIELKNVSKTFKLKNSKNFSLRRNIFHFNKKHLGQPKLKALEDINLTIYKGETVGIIGRNGSGKSTLINIIMGSISPDIKDSVFTDGKLMRLALGMGVDPNLSARDNIYINGSVIGLSFRKIGSIFYSIIEFADLLDFIDTPVKFYSKGMKQRLLFSIAMHAEADVFLLDEFFGGTGDADFKNKSDYAFKKKILEGRTIIMVSHSMKNIQKYCTRTIWLEKGKIMFEGPSKDVVNSYQKSFKSKKS